MSTPARAPSDRNLLFGILALQMDFITRDALIKAMHAWVLEKSKPLGQILLDQGALRVDTHDLLEAMVQKHIEMHGGDAQKSLASVSSLGRSWSRSPMTICTRAWLTSQPIAPSKTIPGPRARRPWVSRPRQGRDSASCGRTPKAVWAKCSLRAMRS
jgi:hypothetical protein